MRRRVRFTDHAKWRMAMWGEHGFSISEEMVEAILDNPSSLQKGHGVRMIAQGDLDETHVLRIVFEETGSEIVVVTLYPARRSRYG